MMYILATIDLTSPTQPEQDYKTEYSLDEAAKAFNDARKKLHQSYPMAQFTVSNGYGELIKQGTFTVDDTVIATIGIYQPSH